MSPQILILMEKNLDDGTKWDDVELMDCKDIYQDDGLD